MKSVIDPGLVQLLTGESFLILSFESCHEKTCLLGFQHLPYVLGAVAWSVACPPRMQAVTRSTLMSGTFFRVKFILLFR